MNPLRLALLALLLLIRSHAADAATFQYSADGFTLPLEGQWFEIPKTELAGYDYGLQQTAGPPWKSLPHILVQVKNIGRLSPDILRKWSADSARLNTDFKAVYGDHVEVESVEMDPERLILWMRLNLSGQGVPDPVKCLAAAVLTDKGLLQINAFSREAERDFPPVETMVRLIEFAPEMAYHRPSPQEPPFEWDLLVTAKWLIIGLSGGIAFFLAFKLMILAYRRLSP